MNKDKVKEIDRVLCNLIDEMDSLRKDLIVRLIRLLKKDTSPFLPSKPLKK